MLTFFALFMIRIIVKRHYNGERMSGFIHPLRPTDSSHLSQGDKVDDNDNDNEESKPSLTLNTKP